MMWPVVYFSVLLFLLLISFVYDPDLSDDSRFCAFVCCWPVTLPYVVIVTLCYWIARGIRGIWGLCCGK